MKIVYLLAGGGIGTLARYLLSGWTHTVYAGPFPLGTLLVNLAGSFAIGVVWGISEIIAISPSLRLFVVMGLLGGFTTFSAFSFDTLSMMREGNIMPAMMNIILNNVLGILFAFSGFLVARGLMGILN